MLQMITKRGSKKTILEPNVPRVIRKFACKDYKLPPLNTQPPYFIEFPLEEGEPYEHSTNSIPTKVEEALSNELAAGLKLKHGREQQTLCITNGEGNGSNMEE